MKYIVHTTCGADTEPKSLLQYIYHHFVFLLEQLAMRGIPFPRPGEIYLWNCFNSHFVGMLNRALLAASTSSWPFAEGL